MKGWQITKHSFRQVFGNLAGALRISALLYLVQLVASFAMGVGVGNMAPGMNGEAFGPGFGLSVLAILVVFVVTSTWIVVAWHRYVLLGEEARILPEFRGDRISAYFLRGLAYAVIVAVIGAIWLGVIGGAAVGVLGTDMVSLMIVMAVLVYFPLVTFGFRLSADLPGMALGTGEKFLTGWNATAGQTKDIAVMSAILVAIGLVANLAVLLVLGRFPALMVVWQAVWGWLQMMVGASVLTTLYGHYIEKRALV